MLKRTFTLGAALALALVTAACSDSSAPGSDGGTANTLSTAEAQTLGRDVVGEAMDMAQMSGFDVSTGFPMNGPGMSVAASNTPPRPPHPPCVAITPLSPVNSDADVVPDSVRFTFTACVFSRMNGEMTDSLDGMIDVFDPLPLAASHGVRHRFTDLTRARTSTMHPGRDVVAVMNGEREWGASADTLGHTVTNFVTQVTHSGGRVTTHQRDWVGKFTATTPGSILPFFPLPAGTWTMNGLGTWTADGRSWSVATTTTVPLVFDPSCTVAPPFTGGTLNLVVTRNGEVTDVQIDFTACGQYTVTRTPGTTT